MCTCEFLVISIFFKVCYGYLESSSPTVVHAIPLLLQLLPFSISQNRCSSGRNKWTEYSNKLISGINELMVRQVVLSSCLIHKNVSQKIYDTDLCSFLLIVL